jgi:hypothetical protein
LHPVPEGEVAILNVTLNQISIPNSIRENLGCQGVWNLNPFTRGRDGI